RSGAADLASRLNTDEGGVFAVGGNLAVVGHDDAGLLAAAEAYAARAPYQWRPGGEKLAALGSAAGITYLKGRAGVSRVFLADGSVKELTTTAVAPPTQTGAAPEPPDAADAESGPARLDLATLYTMRGLFRGTARMPIPSNLDSQLYVPAGVAGIAMANLAARMGLETTGITLPLAVPSTAATVRDVRTKSVVDASSEIGKAAERKFMGEDTASSNEAALAQGEGELRIVDTAFGRQPTVLVRGDEPGATAALGLLANHFPNVWETGKQHASIEEMRYELHRFFSLRSAAGQAAF